MSTQQIVWLAALALVVFWGVGLYNRLVELRQALVNAFAQIDVQLKRRHDLIPNLVEVARKYLQHEQDTLERVVAARHQASAACDLARDRPDQKGAMQALSQAESVLGQAMAGLRAVVEAYPELKGDETLQRLSEELMHTENKVAFARQLFNDAVMDYNVAQQQFPASLVSGALGFRLGEPLQSTQTEAEREPVRVKF